MAQPYSTTMISTFFNYLLGDEKGSGSFKDSARKTRRMTDLQRGKRSYLCS